METQYDALSSMMLENATAAGCFMWNVEHAENYSVFLNAMRLM